jgi:antitoxin component YwqK of YwqJK toxin-antitoxin module
MILKDYQEIAIDKLVSETKGLIDRMNSEFFHNGQISAEGNFVDDKEEGKWIFKDSTGKITGYEFYKKGELVRTK